MKQHHRPGRKKHVQVICFNFFLVLKHFHKKQKDALSFNETFLRIFVELERASVPPTMDTISRTDTGTDDVLLARSTVQISELGEAGKVCSRPAGL